MLNKTLPYEMGRYAIEPGTRPYIYHLILSPEALKATGLLEEVSMIFASRNIPILELKVSTPPRLKVRIIVIVDLKGREDLAEGLRGELSRLRFVEEVTYTPPIAEGVVFDTFSFPLTFMGERSIIMRRAVYEGFIKGGWERFGSAFAAMLYLMGFEAGRKAFVDYYSIFRDPNTQLKAVSAVFQMLGYGVLEFVRVDDNAHRAVVRVYDSFECELFKGAGDIRSGFVRGIIAGFLAGRWNVKEVSAREVKCIARGDPYCEFHVEVEEGSR
ncbi:hypothetical protein MA03_03835 [Infirmifilum uzonense]|uniref:ACT domain-containing protein n=1 Tax=Infirmifilum uzonense TaxID=1550241 RepID=A0A0F7FI43_9CREN|nr:4-vinyl reductase [Infirmifilum uzonense]AKG38590.1 hypothetical protein MA03_03835 [Infirmifilum uzonense]